MSAESITYTAKLKSPVGVLMQHLLCESNKRLQKNFWLNLSMTNKMFKHSDFVTICHVGKKTNRCNLQYYYMHICIFIVNLLFSRKTKNDADRSIINKYSLNLIIFLGKKNKGASRRAQNTRWVYKTQGEGSRDPTGQAVWFGRGPTVLPFCLGSSVIRPTRPRAIDHGS